MTGSQSAQFVEHLRRAGHLRSMEAAGRAVNGAPDQPDAARGLLAPVQSSAHGSAQSPPGQSALGHQSTLGKLWELTDLSANEFADEAARFHACERVSLQELLSG